MEEFFNAALEASCEGIMVRFIVNVCLCVVVWVNVCMWMHVCV